MDDVSSLSNKFSSIPKERATTMLSSRNDSKMGAREYGGIGKDMKKTDSASERSSTRAGQKAAKKSPRRKKSRFFRSDNYSSLKEY